MSASVTLNQLNVIVKDMDATVAFYRRLGLTVEAKSKATHVAITFPNGLLLEFDAPETVHAWDTGWDVPPPKASQNG
jgi:catechol 2,3-dioxygenase-like lactoylglutathione lyase family enzyme